MFIRNVLQHMVTGCEAVCYWRTGLCHCCVYNLRFYTMLVDKVRHLYASNDVQRICFVKSQGVHFDHRVDRVLSLFFSRWSWDPPYHSLTRRQVCPPLVPGGGAHSLAGRGGGPNSNEGTYTVVL
jgi:hypothetical protein